MTGLIVVILCVVLLIVGVSVFKIHPVPVLIITGLILGTATGGSVSAVTESLLSGFGNTLKWIGLVIFFGTVLGEILSETGGAEIIASSIIKLFGIKNLPISMAVIGFLVGIPVFMDVAYLTLLPTIMILSRKSGHSPILLGLALSISLTVSHAMIPPTPGPLAVAAMLEMDISQIIPSNLLVAISATVFGMLWLRLNTKKISAISATPFYAPDATFANTNTPQGFMKILPFLALLLPLLLMSLGSIFADSKYEIISFFKNPVWALMIGVSMSLPLIGKKDFSAKLNKYFNDAGAKCATVILITGAGGAFGQVIKDSSVVNDIMTQAGLLSSNALWIPFLLSMIFTSVTGSITVSLLTTASIVSPLVLGGGLSPELASAAICAGSLGIIHVNSSFFWLFKEMHGVSVTSLIKSFSVLSFITSLGAGLAIALLAYFH